MTEVCRWLAIVRCTVYAKEYGALEIKRSERCECISGLTVDDECSRRTFAGRIYLFYVNLSLIRIIAKVTEDFKRSSIITHAGNFGCSLA